jgi:hypothetical protein
MTIKEIGIGKKFIFVDDIGKVETVPVYVLTCREYFKITMVQMQTYTVSEFVYEDVIASQLIAPLDL